MINSNSNINSQGISTEQSEPFLDIKKLEVEIKGA